MKKLLNIYNALIGIFLYAPIFVIVFFSFNSGTSRSSFEGFSLQWYAELLEDDLILRSLYYSVVIAVLSALIATVIGTLAAIGINSLKGWKKSAYLAVNNIPVVNPDIVTAISMMILFVFVLGLFNSMEMGFGTLLIAHITFNIPYVVLSVLPKLRGMDQNIYYAALDLGCPPMKSFIKVVIPQIMPGIVSGLIMAFTLSLDDFVISYFNSGATFQTLPITIYSMTKKPYSLKLNALSTILFAVVLVLMLAVNLKKPQKAQKKA
ncbi:MAG: ABC transporter permease [Oscillospiraceae bacterium]|nr:ABC transporter permease [Oscillospiraceae bacterium]